jgi:hypothetical protein
MEPRAELQVVGVSIRNVTGTLLRIKAKLDFSKSSPCSLMWQGAYCTPFGGVLVPPGECIPSPLIIEVMPLTTGATHTLTVLVDAEEVVEEEEALPGESVAEGESEQGLPSALPSWMCDAVRTTVAFDTVHKNHFPEDLCR